MGREYPEVVSVNILNFEVSMSVPSLFTPGCLKAGEQKVQAVDRWKIVFWNRGNEKKKSYQLK